MTHTHVSSHPQVKIWKKTQTCGFQTPSPSTFKVILRKKKIFKLYNVYSKVRSFWIYITVSFFKIFLSLPMCVKISILKKKKKKKKKKPYRLKHVVFDNCGIKLISH